MSLCDAEKLNGLVSTCMVPTIKHRGGGVMVWVCFTGDSVGDLATTAATKLIPIIPSG